MCRYTGKLITSDLEHFKQSVEDIFTTPMGSRCMNREYGSRLFELIDSPMNRIDVYSAVAESLLKYEKNRFELKQVHCETTKDGVLDITIVGRYIPTQEQVKFNVEARI